MEIQDIQEVETNLLVARLIKPDLLALKVKFSNVAMKILLEWGMYTNATALAFCRDPHNRLIYPM